MDVSQLQNYIFVAVVLIIVAIAVKFGGNLFGNLLFSQKRGKAIRSAFTLAAPRGEFSIVIIKTGVDIGAVSAFLFPLVGVISIITAFLSPFLIKASDKVVPMLEKKNV
jgi:CPA2 family monovalent cation:H+ antiporter-2